MVQLGERREMYPLTTPYIAHRASDCRLFVGLAGTSFLLKRKLSPNHNRAYFKYNLLRPSLLAGVKHTQYHHVKHSLL